MEPVNYCRGKSSFEAKWTGWSFSTYNFSLQTQDLMKRPYKQYMSYFIIAFVVEIKFQERDGLYRDDYCCA